MARFDHEHFLRGPASKLWVLLPRRCLPQLVPPFASSMVGGSSLPSILLAFVLCYAYLRHLMPLALLLRLAQDSASLGDDLFVDVGHCMTDECRAEAHSPKEVCHEATH